VILRFFKEFDFIVLTCLQKSNPRSMKSGIWVDILTDRLPMPYGDYDQILT